MLPRPSSSLVSSRICSSGSGELMDPGLLMAYPWTDPAHLGLDGIYHMTASVGSNGGGDSLLQMREGWLRPCLLYTLPVGTTRLFRCQRRPFQEWALLLLSCKPQSRGVDAERLSRRTWRFASEGTLDGNFSVLEIPCVPVSCGAVPLVLDDQVSLGCFGFSFEKPRRHMSI